MKRISYGGHGRGKDSVHEGSFGGNTSGISYGEQKRGGDKTACDYGGVSVRIDCSRGAGQLKGTLSCIFIGGS